MYFICVELNQITIQYTLQCNPHADSRDCMAASDYKHPGWLLSISVCILQCGLREDWDGEGCCQTVTGDRDTSFLSFYFPCPPAAPSPLLPDYQTTIAAFWPSSQVDSFTDNHVTGAVKTMSTRPCRRAARSGRPSILFTVSQSPPNMTQYHH